jgi:hypothetical protein
MKAVSAHVQNGQIVLDEPVELPDGAAVEEFARGDYEDARAFADKLVRGS